MEGWRRGELNGLHGGGCASEYVGPALDEFGEKSCTSSMRYAVVPVIGAYRDAGVWNNVLGWEQKRDGSKEDATEC